MKLSKLILSPGNPDLAGIARQYPLEEAAWIWADDAGAVPPVFVRFRLSFISDGTPIRMHVSADQRYEMTVDGEHVSRGPEAGDPRHWAFSSYELDLTEGEHELCALVWAIGGHAPHAHMTHEPGFVLAAEGEYAQVLDTGLAPWTAEVLGGISLLPERKMPGPHFIGSAGQLDARVFQWEPVNEKPAVVVQPALPDWGWRWGLRMSERCVRPAMLPEQRAETVRPGRICAVLSDSGEPGTFTFVPPEACNDPRVSLFESLLNKGRTVHFEPGESVAILWDLEDYYCGYPVLSVAAGRDSSLTVEWAESLFDELEPVPGAESAAKGQRDAVGGKYFRGFGDTYIADGEERGWRHFWWRSGRFLILRVKVSTEPLELREWCIEKVGMPLEFEGGFEADAELRHVLRMCQRGLEMCAHEHFVDCPHYEQLMYLGDSRVQALCLYASVRDASLQRRSLVLADWSRMKQEGGWTLCRYPARGDALIPPFSLIWIGMLRDHLDWRGEADFVRSLLPGVWAVLQCCQRYLDKNGLLGQLPGWPFVDWSPEWDNGVPPGALDGASSVVNLLYAWALKHAVYLATHLGEPARASMLRERRAHLLHTVRTVFWDENRGLMADDEQHRSFSQHGQVLAILNHALDKEQAARAWRGCREEALHETTLYFRHYFFEAAFLQHDPEAFFRGLKPWHDMLEAGACTPWERPEPSRSDCHGWGSNPLFWTRAGLAGIRPAAPGFKSVRVAPQPGPLNRLEVAMPHPAGMIEAKLTFAEGECRGSIDLPADVSGTFHWQGHRQALHGGRNPLSLPI